MARCALIADFFARQFPRDFLLLFFSFFFSRSKHHGRFIKGLACYYYSFGFRTARNEQSGGVIVFKREQIIASIHASRENTSIDRRCVFFFPIRDFARLSSRCVRWANKIPLIVRKNLEHVPQRIRLNLCYRKGS